ncbi:uncharacterized protein UTRI_04453 [Ustilago trichophora]|uniref:SRR1-like domain-containing protein n=1 Tax=Ustilago trichophora TaxID=86804 RepID=A0A5C3EEV8_9BASI|nr:uncharacterized protein UTRI_04453 [Ustilago trichophora]
MMEDTQDEDQETPFEYVKSKRRPKNPHRRPPPAATFISSSSSSSSSTVKAGTSYSNSSGSILDTVHGGFAYSSTSSSMRGGRKKGKNRNGTAMTLNQEEEAQRTLNRACGMVDVFVRYLSSEMHVVPDENEDGKAKVKDKGVRGRSYAGKMRDCFEAVWPSSLHQRTDLHNNKTAKQNERGDTKESHNQEQKASKAKEQVNLPIPSKIVCLGLGSPLTSKSAQVQLALLVVLRRWISLLLGDTAHSKTCQEENEKQARENKARVSESIAVPSEVQAKESSDGRWEGMDQERDGVECVAYDPIFTVLDEILLSRYGINVARSDTDTSSNAEASEKSTSIANTTVTSTPDLNPTPPRSIELHYTAIKTPTLLYMPHCDRDLYEHILSLNYPPSSSSITPSTPFPTSKDTPVILLSNILTNYATFSSNLETSCPTLSKLLPQFTIQHIPNWDGAKRSALIHDAQQDDKISVTLDTIREFGKGWDKNALRDLAFHWLYKHYS